MNTRLAFALLAALLCAVTTARAQPQAAPPPPAAIAPDGTRSTAAMAALAASITEVERDLTDARTKLKGGAPADEKARLEAEVKRLGDKRDGLLRSLELVATGFDPGAFDETKESALDLQAETMELLLPIVQELRQATASPREVESLRRQVSALRKRSALAADAVRSIDEHVQRNAAPTLKPRLVELQDRWKKLQTAADTELAVAEYKLDQLEAKRGGMIGALRSVTGSFFRERGRNLLLAFCSGLLVFGVMRLFWRRLKNMAAMQHGERRLGARALMVVWLGGSVVLAIAAVLLVFYLAGDWVLLGVSVLFLMGIAWTGKHTLPSAYEQIKMVLNLGSVREGERVIYHGLPWKVRALGVFTELRNPALEGGVLRLPLRDLMPLVSRPDGTEAWFPSAKDDWVHLSDGTHGKIVTQTPDWVELVLLGGSRRTFPTSEFLRLCPENLMGGFRVRSIFGIDYKHQAVCTTEIPGRLGTKLERDLRALVGVEHLRNVSVEFHEAAALSLNYIIQADFTPEAAARYTALPRAIQAACVEACNENGWEIPPAPAVTVSAAPVHV